MKLTEHLKSCSPITKSNTIVAFIAGNVKIQVKNGKGTITATNLETEYVGSFQTNWPDFNGVVQAKLLSRALSLIPDPVVTIDDCHLTFTGTGSVSLIYCSSEDWPTMDQVDNDPVPVNPDRIKLLSNFVSTDMMRPNVCGVYLGPKHYAATDCHVLIKYSECVYPFPVIIPADVAKLATSQLATNQTHGVFSSSEYQITFRLIDGNFPDVDAVIPIHNDDLKEDQPKAISYEFGPIVPMLDPNIPIFKIVDNNLTLIDVDYGFEAKIPVTDLPNISFNSKLFTKIAKIGTTFEISTPDCAAVHRAPGMIALIMPIVSRN